jgi:NADPH:quinone reductase-like Zn-dependent oxidoreductase
MKAIIYHRYGSARVLQAAELPRPIIQGNEVLVKIEAAALNPKDSYLREGKAGILTGNKFPKQTGFDFSGTIVAVGQKVKGYNIGDEVFGFLNYLKGGTIAEYLAVRRDWFARKPAELSHITAASIPCAYLTALQVLRDIAGIEKAKKILIYGASGGVGTAAMQLANYYGAEITSVSSFKNKSYCEQQGATIPLAYDRDDIWSLMQRDYDLVFEVYNQTKNFYQQSKAYIRKTGIFVTLSPRVGAFLKTVISFLLPKRFKQFMIRTKASDLLYLAELALNKHINPQVVTFGFDEAIKAYELLDSHHVTGKIVIETKK